ncbi:TPA: hypothetical protein I8Y21_004510 [Klebsiella oxytoca]|uniref:Uncharacterized protein n=1 Tax=Klebsiella oxytoca TaxID=571 RepID=A0AAN5LC23_KLEOX|nr:hypothetical protein [Klebsiella oxytoca]
MYELIYRTGRLFVHLFHPLTCHRDGCRGSIPGRVYRILCFAWQLLVLRPATFAGLVLVVTFLYQKMHGAAVSYWQGVLQAQAASYHDAATGFVMQMSGCLIRNAASPETAVLPLPEPEDSGTPRFCEPRRVAVSIAWMAQRDVAVFTAFYITLVFLSFIRMVFSRQVLPVATERKDEYGRAGRSRVVRVGDDILTITPGGEYHAMRVDNEGRRIPEVHNLSGGRDE